MVQFHISPSRQVIETEGGLDALRELQQEGHVRFIGSSSTLPNMPNHVEMGVFDPFAIPKIREFYDSTARAESSVPVKLHVMRLNGEIVAVRYNIVHGDRLFCLISSMSDDQITLFRDK